MENNLRSTQQMQPTSPTPAQEQKLINQLLTGNNNTKVALIGLIILIIALAIATIFFDRIKSIVTGTPNVVKISSKSPVNPNEICAKFTSSSIAVTNSSIACILDLSGQKLTLIPPNIYQLTSLKVLNVSSNRISEVPAGIAAMKTLKEINLSNNQISTIPSTLSTLPNLELIDLSNNQISRSEQNRIRGVFSSKVKVVF